MNWSKLLAVLAVVCEDAVPFERMLPGDIPVVLGAVGTAIETIAAHVAGKTATTVTTEVQAG